MAISANDGKATGLPATEMPFRSVEDQVGFARFEYLGSKLLGILDQLLGGLWRRTVWSPFGSATFSADIESQSAADCSQSAAVMDTPFADRLRGQSLTSEHVHVSDVRGQVFHHGCMVRSSTSSGGHRSQKGRQLGNNWGSRGLWVSLPGQF